jgi:16S rRNA (adenine1518-N6/adenine1519-N6)-dimethyltransferase
MITLLKERIQSGEWGDALIEIHHQDVLRYHVPYETYSVIANIPYYITSPILFHFLYPTDHSMCSPEEMVIMMQSEVGEKILE